MAVPTFTSVTPSFVHTSGKTAVMIEGTNFRLPVIQADGPTDGASLRSVEVLFGSEPAIEANAVDVSRIEAIAPVSDPATVAITIRNVENDGTPIPGEEVVVPAAFEFRHANLTSERENASDLQRAVRKIIRDLKQQVHPNVALTTDTDYDAPDNVEIHVVEIADKPAIVLIGPSLEENRFYSVNGEQDFNDERQLYEGGEDDQFENFVSTYQPFTVDISFEVIVVSDRQMEALNLSHLLMMFFRKNTSFKLDRSNDPADGEVEFEMAMTSAPRPASAAGNSNVHSYTSAFTIYGFDIDSTAGLEDASSGVGWVRRQDVFRIGKTAESVDLDPVESVAVD